MSFSQFFSDNLILFLLFFASVIGIIIYEIKNKGSKGVVIDSAQCALKVNNGALLLDLRSFEEYKKGHIAGAKSISTEHFLETVNKLANNDKNREIIICDKDGYLCKNQAAILVANSYTNVFTLQYGVQGWIGDNLPVVS
ncbi:MAG: rhodanese-like domain-containing protein [Cardiobacteriaceae bacterium]|nr:rhodanese-like domain-containing protein [Cardiobacteriaceae bacterium]